MTNWAQIFMCWDTPRENTGIFQFTKHASAFYESFYNPMEKQNLNLKKNNNIQIVFEH